MYRSLGLLGWTDGIIGCWLQRLDLVKARALMPADQNALKTIVNSSIDSYGLKTNEIVQ